MHGTVNIKPIRSSNYQLLSRIGKYFCNNFDVMIHERLTESLYEQHRYKTPIILDFPYHITPFINYLLFSILCIVITHNFPLRRVPPSTGAILRDFSLTVIYYQHI